MGELRKANILRQVHVDGVPFGNGDRWRPIQGPPDELLPGLASLLRNAAAVRVDAAAGECAASAELRETRQSAQRYGGRKW